MTASDQSENCGRSHATTALHLPADRFSRTVEITDWSSRIKRQNLVIAQGLQYNFRAHPVD
jgi:hypothetical protein